MTAVALIVEYQTPDLLALCLASLKKFAPTVKPLVLEGGDGAEHHAAAIEAARRWRMPETDIVILLDTDVVILSDEWWPWVEASLKDVSAVGGLRHRGDVTQLYCEGTLLLHAHCLAMRRDLFEAVLSFKAFGAWDTAWEVSRLAHRKFAGTHVVVPQSGEGWPARVGVYADQGTWLWAHLGRGTSFRPRPWEREVLRKLAARLGSPRAKKILSYQEDRAAFLRKGWEIVNG